MTTRTWPRHAWWLALALLLAACGKSSGTVGQSFGTATPQPTMKVQPTGCPLANQTVTWPPPVPAQLSPEKSATITIKKGQTVEVVLAFGHRWALITSPVDALLHLDAPAGYGDAALQSCIWHFTARQAGQTTLTYSLAPLCVAGYRCSGTETLVNLSITVTG